MNTDELIERLTTGLEPVRPMATPWRQTSRWLVAGAVYLSLVGVMVVTGMSVGGANADGLYVIQQLAALTTGVAAAFAAFSTVVPGYSRRVVSWPAASGGVWLMSTLWGCVRDVRALGTFGIGGQTDWPCVISIAVGGALLWGVMTMMLRRGAPLSPRLTALLAGLAALEVANVEACLTRPHAFNSVVLFWHGGTVAVMALLMTLSGRRWLRWPGASRMPV